MTEGVREWLHWMREVRGQKNTLHLRVHRITATSTPAAGKLEGGGGREGGREGERERERERERENISLKVAMLTELQQYYPIELQCDMDSEDGINHTVYMYIYMYMYLQKAKMYQ